ncbi:MAG: hypothetical protein ACRDFW_09760 [bacterium]
MQQARLAILIAITLTFGAAAVAYAPYHTQPAPPPSPTPPPTTTAPSGMSVIKAQAKIAATHAGFAAAGSTMGSAKEHLGHTLACIEGPKGRNVKPEWMNPCSGTGNGVLVDLGRIRATATLIRAAQEADATAVAAIKSSNLTQVKSSARRVAQLINRIATAK